MKYKCRCLCNIILYHTYFSGVDVGALGAAYEAYVLALEQIPIMIDLGKYKKYMIRCYSTFLQ